MQDRNAKAIPRLPSLELLKGFEAAARLLSFTKAGEELHLTQSAVSRQIQELEQQLGVPLFQRRHRSLVLTDAGQQVFAAAAQVLATMRAVTDRVTPDLFLLDDALQHRRVARALDLVAFTDADLDAVLARYNQVVDVSRDDLHQLLEQTHIEAYRRRSSSSSSVRARFDGRRQTSTIRA